MPSQARSEAVILSGAGSLWSRLSESRVNCIDRHNEEQAGAAELFWAAMFGQSSRIRVSERRHHELRRFICLAERIPVAGQPMAQRNTEKVEHG
jgi:hypothetical protein